MKYAVIDIGSNSVRLMIFADGKTLFKRVNTTRLGEGLAFSHILKEDKINLTVEAINNFILEAKENNTDKLYAFATAAVRNSLNKEIFLKKVKEKCGIEIEVISGEKEAELGLKGVLNLQVNKNGKSIDNETGGIIDIGGASTEIIVSKNQDIIYNKSLDIGVVRLLDICGQNKERLEQYIKEKILEYKDVPKSKMYAIGGTATTLAAVKLKLKIYDPSKVNGSKIYIEEIKDIKNMLLALPLENRKNVYGVPESRAEVIAGGAILLYEIMKYLKLEEIIISESDNLEGYLLDKISRQTFLDKEVNIEK